MDPDSGDAVDVPADRAGEGARPVGAPTGWVGSGEPALRFEDACVSIGGHTVWQGLCLDVGSGEFTAILGPNGAGKSTLLKAILGLHPLSGGRVEVFGRSPRRGNPAIGYLPQRRAFDVDVPISGRELVRLGLTGARWGLALPRWLRSGRGRAAAGEEDRRVREVLDLVGATAFADRPIGAVSGGEQQRLLIAQALVTRPKLLLFDEPFESLDLHHQQAVAALIARVARAAGMTVLLVTHDVNPILPYLDRVLYVARGRVAAGRPDEVLTSEALSRLYQAPIDVLRARDGRIAVLGQPPDGHHDG